MIELDFFSFPFVHEIYIYHVSIVILIYLSCDCFLFLSSPSFLFACALPSDLFGLSSLTFTQMT